MGLGKDSRNGAGSVSPAVTAIPVALAVSATITVAAAVAIPAIAAVAVAVSRRRECSGNHHRGTHPQPPRGSDGDHGPRCHVAVVPPVHLDPEAEVA